MLKRLVTTVIMSACVAGAAYGQGARVDNQCETVAAELAQMAEAKQLANDKLDKIEEMLGKMEDLCDADKLAEAMAVAKDIETEINTQ